jgi:hypothetical protein
MSEVEKGSGDFAEFHVLSRHVYTYVDVPRGRLVRGMEPHGDCLCCRHRYRKDDDLRIQGDEAECTKDVAVDVGPF